jgi:hypothetical protein
MIGNLVCIFHAIAALITICRAYHREKRQFFNDPSMSLPAVGWDPMGSGRDQQTQGLNFI